MPTYRIEISPNNRAGCKGSPDCKTNQAKLAKGEIRFGTWVEIKEHGSWAWRHWGCVTPQVLIGLKDVCEGDMDLVDGYDDLDSAMQQKVGRAIEQGHVDDEDWKGDVEYNRPGMKGFASRKKKATKGTEDEEPEIAEKATKMAAPKKRRKADEDGSEAEDAPVAKKSRSKKATKTEGKVEDVSIPAPAKNSRAKKAVKKEDEEEDEDEADPVPAPAKKSRVKKAAKQEDKDEDEREADPVPAPKPKSRAKKAVKVEEDEESEAETTPAPIKRSRSKKAVKAEDVDETKPIASSSKGSKKHAVGKGAKDDSHSQKKSRAKRTQI